MEKLTDIPGWNTEPILEYLCDHVRRLPENSKILEIGGFFGRTTRAMGISKKSTVQITTIDPWMTYDLSYFTGDKKLHDNQCSDTARALLEYSEKEGRIEGDDFFRLWKYFCKDIDNLNPIREYSPPVVDKEWPDFDFIYHDGDHSYDGVRKDLEFWFPKLKKHGIMIIDDYAPQEFHGLCRAVEEFIEKNGLEYKLIFDRNIEIKRKT